MPFGGLRIQVFILNMWGIFVYAGFICIAPLGSYEYVVYIEYFEYFSILRLQGSFVLSFLKLAITCLYIEYLSYFSKFWFAGFMLVLGGALRIYVSIMNI